MQDEDNNEQDNAPQNEQQHAGDAPEWVGKVFDFMSKINERLQALEKPPAPAPAPPAPAPQEDKEQEDKKGNGLYF